MKSRAERQSQKKVESEESRISRKKIHTSVTKVAKFFSMIGGSDGSKSRLAKAAGAEVAIQRRKKNCTPLRHEERFQVKILKRN